MQWKKVLMGSFTDVTVFFFLFRPCYCSRVVLSMAVFHTIEMIIIRIMKILWLARKVFEFQIGFPDVLHHSILSNAFWRLNQSINHWPTISYKHMYTSLGAFFHHLLKLVHFGWLIDRVLFGWRAVNLLVDRLIGWMVDRSNDWLNDWLIDWSIDWLIEWSIDWLSS